MFPSACQIGATVEITLVGSGLDEDAELFFTRGGFTAETIGKGRFRVACSADAAAGDCDLWVATRSGVAGPRRFSMTSAPVVCQQPLSDLPGQAQPLTIPTLLAAKLDQPAELNWFSFEGQQAQQITIRCRSATLDGSLQPVFTLVGPDRTELVHSLPHQVEPQLTYRLPAAGTYALLIHDRAYRKDDFSFFQLELSTDSPEPATIESRTSLIRPDDLMVAIEVQDERLRSRRSPQAIQLPCRLTGRFAERNKVDWFRIQVKKDQVVHLEAFGQRLGQRMDLEAAFYNADDKLVTTASDFAAPKGLPAALQLDSLDPVIDWKVPADGDYWIALRDLYGGSVFGADRVYELIVETQQPRCFVVAMPAGQPGRGVFVKQAGKAELAVNVVRSGGFAGPVTVRAEESLRGITLEPCVLDGKEITSAIKLSAAKDAPAGFQSLRLVADAEIGSDTLTIPVRNAAQLRAGATRLIDQMVIYVGESG